MTQRQRHDQIQRARWQLWAVTFAILGSLAAVVVFVSSGTQERVDALPEGTLRIALLGLIAGFVLYAIDRERNLRRLGDALTDEQVETAQLNTKLHFLSELQRERDTNAALLDGAADGIAVVDKDLRLLRFNSAMRDLTGWSPSRVLGGLAPVVMQFTATDGTKLDGDAYPLAAVLAEGLPRPAAELMLRQPDGEQRWVSGTFSPILDPATSEPILALAILRDISTQKEIEQMQRDFVWVVSHELRAPLTAIRGFAKTLVVKDEELSPQSRREFLATVNEQAERLARLVDDLLQVSRIEAKRVRVEWTEVPLAKLVGDLIVQFHSKWGSRRILLDLDPMLPALRVDRAKVEEILINLIDNAIKYSPEHTPIRVSASVVGDEIEVSIADRGFGIAAEDVSLLFQKFQRITTNETRDIAGTGLGLYIVKGLVEAHGGRVTVSSTPGAGSTFAFTVPRARAVPLRQEAHA